MGDILAFAEQRAGQVRAAANEVLSAAAGTAAELGGSADALVLGGPGVGDVVGGLGAYGAASIRVAEDDALAEYSPATYAPVVAEVARSGDYDAILFPATAQGKDLAPRVAALLDTPLASDITRLEVDGGELVAVRPIYAGKGPGPGQIPGLSGRDVASTQLVRCRGDQGGRRGRDLEPDHPGGCWNAHGGV